MFFTSGLRSNGNIFLRHGGSARTSQLRMSSMVSRSLPWRSWKVTACRAAWSSALWRPLWAPLQCRSRSCSSRLYLLTRCTGFSRYDHRSILSASACCFCCRGKGHRGTTTSNPGPRYSPEAQRLKVTEEQPHQTQGLGTLLKHKG